MRRVILSNSKRSNVVGCMKYFDYYENKRLSKRGREEKFRLGTLYHEWMETFFLHYLDGITDAMTLACAITSANDLENAPLINSMGTQSVYGLRRDGFFDRYTVMAVEWPFRMDVTRSGVRMLHDDEEGFNEFVGVVDLVLFDTVTKCYIPLDHKSSSDREDSWLNGFFYSWQQVGYMVAVREGFGEIGMDALYSVARKKIPSTPKINKNGSLSIAKCDTTPEVIENMGIDVPDGYIEKMCVNKFHWTAKRRAIDADFAEWHKDLLGAFSEYRRRLRSDNYPRQAWYECKKCTYKDLCFAPGDEVMFMDQFEILPESEYPVEFAERMENASNKIH